MRVPSLATAGLAAALAVMSMPLPAQADVIYSFNEVGNPGFPSVSFTLDVPTFITMDSVFTPGANFSCTATGTYFATGHAQTCLSAEFTPGPSFDSLLIVFSDIGLGDQYALGDFGNVGTYSTAFDPNGVSNSLTVALSTVATTVPEPLTLSIFTTGLIGTGVMRMRGKRALQTARTV